MRTLPRQELQAPMVPSEIRKVIKGIASGAGSPGFAARSAYVSMTYNIRQSLLITPRVCPPHERHVRRPGWTELFFDLVFAAAIAQLSGPLGHDYSVYGIARFGFLLALVFLAWFGYTSFRNAVRHR